MTRDQRIADLVIHGWEPIYDSMGCHGIGHPDLELGFAVLILDPKGQAKMWKVKRIGRWTTTEWDRITDFYLNVLEERLSAV